MSQQKNVVIVTGASQGIGAGLVAGFVECGYQVIANSRSIRAGNQDIDAVYGVPGDISDPVVAERVVREAVDRFGRVDSLINNAGIFVSKPFDEYTPEDFTRVLSVNLAGFFHVTQHAIRQMLRQGQGHIVQISTTLAEHPLHAVPAALASLTKGGLNAVTKGLAIEYADRGIRVNAISPGIVRTPMHPPEQHDFLSNLHPLGRMGEVKEIVDAVLYLESAGFVTGEILHVDGGQHAGH